jgi:hypothetical protein
MWSGSIGLIALLLRHLVRRRRAGNLQVGSVSDDWLAQHRGSGDQYF